jgi:integrase/recombinase XerD
MAKKRGPRDYTLPGNPADPQGLHVLGLRYMEWLRVKHYTESTVFNTWRALCRFMPWCEQRGIDRPNQITPPILERYARHLYYARKKDGEPLSIATQRGLLTPLVGYFRWLTKQRHILYNPASELEQPRVRQRLPRHVLTADEAQQVLNLPNLADPIGIRDRAILETLYSTGMRRMELANLKRQDVDLNQGTVLILQGKGRKDRFIPIGERACRWIEKYLAEVRPELVTYHDDGTLFLTAMGEPFNPHWLSTIVSEYVSRANLNKRGGCHLFRHTLATVMLENGADIRHIQAILGHADLKSTQIYTHLNIRQLKAIHDATHPAAKLKPKANEHDESYDHDEMKTTGTEPPVLNEGNPDPSLAAAPSNAADTTRRGRWTGPKTTWTAKHMPDTPRPRKAKR